MSTVQDQESQALVHVPCDLCGSDNPEVLFVKKGFRHVRCRTCGLVYVSPRLGNPLGHQETFYENISLSYGDLEDQALQDYIGSRKKRLLREAASYLPYKKNGRILDIGCGFGGFLKAAADQGWEHPEGIEIASQAVEYTRRFFPVTTEPMENVRFTEYSFDVIRLNNVIEHVPSPRSLISSARDSLRPGGLFVISTPNYGSLSVAFCRHRWQYIGGDDHIYLFTPATLSRMLEENGFRVLKIRTKGIHMTPKDHAKKRSSLLMKFINMDIKMAERMLDFLVRQTLKGHRLKVLAERM